MEPDTFTTLLSISEIDEYLEREMCGSIRLDRDWFLFHSRLYKDGESVGMDPRPTMLMGTIKTYFLDRVNGVLSLETDTGTTIRFKVVGENGDGKIFT